MPKVSDAHRAERREQILDAAVACFLRRGVRATTMAEVITESGLSAGAIYGYFESKQELAVAAMQREARGRAAELDEVAHGEVISPGRIIRSVSDAFQRRSPSPALIVQMWGEAASDPEFELIAAAAFRELGAVFIVHLTRWAQEDQGMAAEQAQAWAEGILPVLLGLVQGIILQSTLVPRFDRESYLEGVDSLFRSVTASARDR